MKKSTLSLALCASLFTAWQASAAQTDALTPQQIEQTGKAAEAWFAAHPEKMGEIVATYLAEHPEFLVAAGENLRQRQQVAQQQAFVQAALHQRDALLHSTSPERGPKTAKAAVIVFLDETSQVGQAASELIGNVEKSNPDVRFIFKALAATDKQPLAASALEANLDLAKAMSFTVTPAFVVMPQEQDPEIHRVSVMSGNVSEEALIMAIQKAKK